MALQCAVALGAAADESLVVWRRIQWHRDEEDASTRAGETERERDGAGEVNFVSLNR